MSYVLNSYLLTYLLTYLQKGPVFDNIHNDRYSPNCSLHNIRQFSEREMIVL